jgi:alanine racemase
VMTLTSEICHIKAVGTGTPISYNRTWKADRGTTIGTVAAGYADGFPRRMSNRGSVVVYGRDVPVVGTVCMDMFMIDLGPDAILDRDNQIGAPVILFGKGGNSAMDVARMTDTIPYEIVCRVSNRVPRVYAGLTTG